MACQRCKAKCTCTCDIRAGDGITVERDGPAFVISATGGAAEMMLTTTTVAYEPGSYTFDPAAYLGLQYIDVEVEGGGGGSGGTTDGAGSDVSAAGGGGGGAWAAATINADQLTGPVPVEVGAGGARGEIGADGSPGGTSRFGDAAVGFELVAEGGTGSPNEAAGPAPLVSESYGFGGMPTITGVVGRTGWGQSGGPSIIMGSATADGTTREGQGGAAGNGDLSGAIGRTTATGALPGFPGIDGSAIVRVVQLVPVP